MGTGPLGGVTSELRGKEDNQERGGHSRWRKSPRALRAKAEGTAWQGRWETRTTWEQVAKSGGKVDPSNPRQGLEFKAIRDPCPGAQGQRVRTGQKVTLCS